MRAWLLVVAALAVAPCRATAAQPHPDPARLDRIKSQILAKLGLTTRPTPLGAPPRDVVRQILARAADPHPRVPHIQDNEHAMREVIAIAHRGAGGGEMKTRSLETVEADFNVNCDSRNTLRVLGCRVQLHTQDHQGGAEEKAISNNIHHNNDEN